MAALPNIRGALCSTPQSLADAHYSTRCRAADVSQTLQRRIQGMELRNFRRGHHLCSAGRPSRWASAHILVVIIITVVVFGVAVVVAAVVVVVVGDVNSGSSSGDISNNTHLYSCTINGST